MLDDIGDQHADVVVETVGGDAETLSEAVRIARTGGRLSMLGDFELGVKLAAEHAALIEPIVTHIFALDEVAKALVSSKLKAL
jgi:threonine dehydrogenase-like Zn-dependent dehydrogenase